MKSCVICLHDEKTSRLSEDGAGLTRYLFSPICSTWNLLAHLHWATCRVTCGAGH